MVLKRGRNENVASETLGTIQPRVFLFNIHSNTSSFWLFNFCIYIYIYIYIRYQCFHSVNLTLHTVTSINNRQLKNKIQLETWKQDESCQVIQVARDRE